MREDSDTALEGQLAAWAAAAGCRLCVLFGSRAGSTRLVAGDTDIALLFAALPEPRRRLEIIGEIQGICGRSRADVVFLDVRTDPVLRFEIFRGGKPLHQAVPGFFVDEKVKALMLYEDALPFRRRLRESVRAASKVGTDVS